MGKPSSLPSLVSLFPDEEVFNFWEPKILYTNIVLLVIVYYTIPYLLYTNKRSIAPEKGRGVSLGAYKVGSGSGQ